MADALVSTPRRHFSITRGLLVAAAIGAGVATFLFLRRAEPAPFVVQPITRGDITEAIGATGAVEALTTVQVGTQVTGTVQALYAGDNATVHAGQVIARLDPSLFQTQVEQGRANVTKAEADLERVSLSSADAARRHDQARQLALKGIVAASDRDSAEATALEAAAQVRSARAVLIQARASLNQAEVALGKTVITAPIDGIVIACNVDVGQTVAASLQAPTLFLIAADLTKMRVSANVNEADIGRVRVGQRVRFRVDAFPAEEFLGTLALLRLSPLVQQNVVTYEALIDVDNPDLKLRPGMTATVTIEIAARKDVLRVPASALRFRPPDASLPERSQDAPAAPAGRSSDTRGPREGEGAREGSPRRIWVLTPEGPEEVAVRVVIGDGVHTELLHPALTEGTSVITGLTTTVSRSASPASGTANPLLGGRGGPPRGGR